MKVSRERRLDNLNDEYADTLIAALEAGKSKIQPDLHRYIDHFIEDLRFFKNRWQSYGSKPMSTSLQEAWGSIIIDRFDFLLSGLPSAEDRQALFNAYKDDALAAYKRLGDTYCNFLDIYYSQKTCTASFAHHEHIDKKFIYNGCNLLDVADDLKANPSKVDEIPVRICRVQHKGKAIWMALNNRGLATINLARLRPIRLLIDEPTTDEKNRFIEINEALTLSPNGSDRSVYNFFRNINKTNNQAPYQSITGLKDNVPVFTVAHYIKEAWRFNRMDLQQNCMRYSI